MKLTSQFNAVLRGDLNDPVFLLASSAALGAFVSSPEKLGSSDTTHRLQVRIPLDLRATRVPAGISEFGLTAERQTAELVWHGQLCSCCRQNHWTYIERFTIFARYNGNDPRFRRSWSAMSRIFW